MNTLVIAEHHDGRLNRATRSTITAAANIGASIALLIAAKNAAPVVAEAKNIAGIAKILVAEAAHYARPVAEDMAALVMDLVSKADYSHILAPATSSGKSVMPRLAALLDVALISDVIEIVSPEVFVRPVYAGNALATIASGDPVKLLTVRASAFDADFHSEPNAPAPTIEHICPVQECAYSKIVSHSQTTSTRPELANARVIVAGGRGFGSREHFHALLGSLADKLAAAIGASRAAVDAGFAPNDWQVGQTGKIVAPELYIAIGLSGSLQHLAGIRGSRVIVAINQDPDAPIFQVADYKLVGDLFELVPELIAKLSNTNNHE